MFSTLEDMAMELMGGGDHHDHVVWILLQSKELNDIGFLGSCYREVVLAIPAELFTRAISAGIQNPTLLPLYIFMSSSHAMVSTEYSTELEILAFFHPIIWHTIIQKYQNSRS
jgi:hypothetical protein